MSESEERGHHRHHQTEAQAGVGAAHRPRGWYADLHRKPVFWIGFTLVIGAMLAYVLTQEEALSPVAPGAPGQPVPAAP